MTLPMRGAARASCATPAAGGALTPSRRSSSHSWPGRLPQTSTTDAPAHLPRSAARTARLAAEARELVATLGHSLDGVSDEDIFARLEQLGRLVGVVTCR